MKKTLWLFGLLFLLVGITACSSSQTPELATVEVTRLVEVTREVQITSEVTRIITQEVTHEVKVMVPVTVTFTPGPSPTPTASSTPTITPTSTRSPTPFSVYNCVNLRAVANFWNIEVSDYPTKLYPTYDKLNGKCVKFYASDDLGIVTTDFGWLGMLNKFDITFVIDDMTPPDFRSVSDYSTFWGIWDVPKSGEYRFLIRRAERFPDLEQPISEDGFYMIGKEYDRAPGQWKSLWPPGAVENCYWARTNPNTGDIRDNNFGQAGVYVRIIEGDLLESSNCAPWVFVMP